MHHIKPYYLPALLIIVLTISFFRLGALTLFDVDEAVFAEATREMVETGDWLTPTYNGVNRYDKPILFYWMMALSYKTFGINEWGARFPSASAGVLLCLCLFLFMRRQTDERRAFFAVMSLVLSLYFVIYSHAAVTDMTLTLFITLSLLSFYQSLGQGQESAQHRRFYLYGFYLFSALAFLTKGLIGIIFPFGIAGLYLLVTEGIGGTKKIMSAGGSVLFLLIAIPWYLAELSVNGREFIDQFFIKHHFKRFTDVISGHKGPWYYYALTLLIGLVPWVTFLPGGAAGAWARFRLARSKKGPATVHSPELFALLWFAVIVVFFSVSTTKLPNYILPSIPAAAILIASGMVWQSRKQIQYTKVLMAVVSLLMGVGALVGPVLAEKYLVRMGAGFQTGFLADFRAWTRVLAIILFAGTALNLVGAVRKKSYHELGAVLMLSILLLLSLKVLPVANQYLQGTLHKYSRYALDHLGTEGSLITYKINWPSIVFYSRHTVSAADQPTELEQLLKSDRQTLVITTASEAAGLEKMGLSLIEKDAAYALFERK
ncbi:MAG: glycosyltransferase family 39 protein [Thermodesulfovibrionales bacterium]